MYRMKKQNDNEHVVYYFICGPSAVAYNMNEVDAVFRSCFNCCTEQFSSLSI